MNPFEVWWGQQVSKLESASTPDDVIIQYRKTRKIMNLYVPRDKSDEYYWLLVNTANGKYTMLGGTGNIPT